MGRPLLKSAGVSRTAAVLAGRLPMAAFGALGDEAPCGRRCPSTAGSHRQAALPCRRIPGSAPDLPSCAAQQSRRELVPSRGQMPRSYAERRGTGSSLTLNEIRTLGLPPPTTPSRSSSSPTPSFLFRPETARSQRGTGGSNLICSSGESASRAILPSPGERPAPPTRSQ